MKKYFLINEDVTEIAYFSSDEKAFEEVQKRNKRDRGANWKAYDENGWAVYNVAFCC